MAARDPIGSFVRHLTASLHDDTFVRLLLTSPSAGNVERITGRLVEVHDGTVLSLTAREAKRDLTRNIALEETESWLRAQVPAHFKGALLETTARNWQLTAGRRGDPRLVSHRPTATQAPARTHDRAKQTLLGEAASPWLTALGICDQVGRVRPSMADKHRQIGRFLEIVSHLARDCGWTEGAAPVEPLAIADMGCGKGYLTFGVWHLFNRVLQRPANVIGIETRADLVKQTNEVAQSIGAEGLRFVQGTIADAELPAADALIALHACNTATDDALRRGIASGARLVVVSPCCHQELRPQLGRPEPFAAVLEHGIMAERFSEWLTDGLRALHLEAAGYTTKVIEFVASEHTPRNLLIAGIRRERSDRDSRAGEAADRLKAFFGIGRLAMDGEFQ
ncbi:MAG TPA: methyltransferase [Verrucomicrobiales bacterium]|nr:methyltransferase [Verrucomicrobiales bacterium]